MAVRGRGGDIVGAEINPIEWKRFLRDLRKLDPEVRKQLTKELKALLDPLAQDAKQHAGWSSRIPGAIAKTVAAKRVGLRVRSARAPHARPYEGISEGADGRGFRHPLFGNREVWIQEEARPFLKPAVEGRREEFFDKAAVAVAEAARKTGWK